MASLLAQWICECGGGPGFESLSDDTMDNMNVVVDTLDEEDDDKESNHSVVKVVVELYFISIHRNIINPLCIVGMMLVTDG